MSHASSFAVFVRQHLSDLGAAYGQNLERFSWYSELPPHICFQGAQACVETAVIALETETAVPLLTFFSCGSVSDQPVDTAQPISRLPFIELDSLAQVLDAQNPDSATKELLDKLIGEVRQALLLSSNPSSFFEVQGLVKATSNSSPATDHTQLLNTIIDKIPTPIFFKDTKGIYLGFNQSFRENISGLDKNWIGKSVYDIYEDRDLADTYYKADNELFVNPGIQVYETQMRYVNGVRQDVVFYKATFWNTDGSLGGLVGTILEITERKKAQRALQTALDRAEAANKAKNTFLSSMSHELRTPLNGILGYTQILKRRFQQDPTTFSSLDVIESSGQHLLTLINDILDFSQIEAGKMVLVPTEFDLFDFLKDVTDIIRSRAQEKHISFNIGRPQHSRYIRADETRLRQVLLNLLGNAVKFTDFGEVTLKLTTATEPKPAADEQQLPLRFEIVDTGSGITAEDLARIFQPFEQAGNNVKRREGTGLGLAITRQLVELMGSELQVVSEVGKGSTFWFEVAFPLVDGIVVEAETAVQQIVGYKGDRKSLLVVDDNETNLLVLQNMLQPLGFGVIKGEDGHDVVNMAQAHLPDAILTDLVMPNLDGFAAIQQVRSNPAIAHIPILAISASVEESDQERSHRFGADYFLPKPVQEVRLLAVLGDLLEIEWEFEVIETAVLSEADLVVPPGNQLEILYEVSRMGSMLEVLSWADNVEVLDTKYAPFANQVRALAHDFEDEQITELARQHLG
ncbi:MAG: ATP-binding protein [Chloroflexota bacterium]